MPPGDDFETQWAAGVHADALLFLASAYDADDAGPRRTRLRTLVAAAVAHAVKGQTDRGAWGDARGGGEADDTQLTAGVLHALAAARAAGVEVPAAVFERAARYYAAATTTEGGVTYSLSAVRPGGARADVTNPVSTALAAASFLTAPRRPPELRRWVAAAERTMPAVPGSSRPGGFTSSVAFMLQSLAFARVAHALGDDGYRSLVPGASGGVMRWSAHRERLFPCVRGAQSPDGSWADASFGPARATALALIILQLDNDYLPAFSR